MGHDPAGTIPNPHPPGGNPEGGAVELHEGGANRVAWLLVRQLEPRPGRDVSRADGDEFDLAGAVGVAVPLLVREMELLRDVAAERDGELEGLAAIADIRLALRREVVDLGE